MKYFYHQTYLFWVITKFLIALAGIGSFFSILTMVPVGETFSFLANISIFLYALLLAYSAYADIRSVKPNRGIRIITGSFSIILGFSIIGLISLSITRNPLLAFLLSLWMLLLGIYEWMLVERLS